MNYDLLFFIIFCIALYIFYQKNKSKFEIQNKFIALYRTKIGLKLMDKLSKLPKKFLHVLGTISIIVGFTGMALMLYILIKGTYSLLFIPKAQPVLAPVLPGITIPGLPTLSFWHWIIAIFVVAIIHEFSHGVFARFHKLKIKSSGFAFFGPILAAFVEPDENQLKKKSKYVQLSIFSAGPFSNIVTGFIILLISIFLITPLSNSMLEPKGIQIISVEENFPAANAGLKQGDKIISVDNIEIKTLESFTSLMKDKKPGDVIDLKTQNGNFKITLVQNPQDASKGYLGVKISIESLVVKESIKEKYGTAWPWTVFWLSKLFLWLWLISIGIALVNLLPLGPVDGGRMFYTVMFLFTKNEKKIQKIWVTVSVFVLLLIVINLLPYIIKLLKFIFLPIISLL